MSPRVSCWDLAAVVGTALAVASFIVLCLVLWLGPTQRSELLGEVKTRGGGALARGW